MSCHSLLAWRVSIERSAVIIMGMPLWVICCFSLTAFNICSLCVIFVNLINMCLGGVSPWVSPVWDSWGFLELGSYFLPHFREVFSYYLLKYFLMAFLLVIFFCDAYDSMVGVFNIVPEALWGCSHFILFSLFLCFIYFHHSIFHLTYPTFCLILLLDPPRVLLISFIALFIIDWPLF